MTKIRLSYEGDATLIGGEWIITDVLAGRESLRIPVSDPRFNVERVVVFRDGDIVEWPAGELRYRLGGRWFTTSGQVLGNDETYRNFLGKKQVEFYIRGREQT